MVQHVLNNCKPHPLFCSVLYTQKSLSDDATIFLDPNTFSEDGTVSLGTSAFSEDGELFAYAISQSGSDWQTIKVSLLFKYNNEIAF